MLNQAAYMMNKCMVSVSEPLSSSLDNDSAADLVACAEISGPSGQITEAPGGMVSMLASSDQHKSTALCVCVHCIEHLQHQNCLNRGTSLKRG
jgi:hypothetical protein